MNENPENQKRTNIPVSLYRDLAIRRLENKGLLVSCPLCRGSSLYGQPLHVKNFLCNLHRYWNT